MRNDLISMVGIVTCAACGPSFVDDDAGGEEATDAARTGSLDSSSRIDAPPAVVNGTIYAHTSTMLYQIDSGSLSVTPVGAFDFPDDPTAAFFPPSITDIALNKDGAMYAVGGRSIGGAPEAYVYSVQIGSPATCTTLHSIPDAYNGLSFVPANPADPGGAEILVATSQGKAGESSTVLKIDPTSGTATTIGNYGNGIRSSGDLVSVKGDRVYATVIAPGVATDALAWIDVCESGCDGSAHVIGTGGTGFTNIWGVGFWGNATLGNKVFGFTSGGKVVTINVTTGEAAVVPDAPAAEWWGAGVFSGVAPFED